MQRTEDSRGVAVPPAGCNINNDCQRPSQRERWMGVAGREGRYWHEIEPGVLALARVSCKCWHGLPVSSSQLQTEKEGFGQPQIIVSERVVSEAWHQAAREKGLESTKPSIISLKPHRAVGRSQRQECSN